MFHPVTIERARIVGSYQYVERAMLDANEAVRVAERNLTKANETAAAIFVAYEYMKSQIMQDL